MRDPRYDILFEPVKIGPVTARNRFFQVPHCNGMGYRDPSSQAYMRQVKAEGGWAVVCTEQVEIHPTSDIGPFIELRLWDDHDMPALAKIAEKIHEGGALAGIELAHNGLNSPNLISRETPLAPQHLPVVSWNYDPVQARAMTKSDIADMRHWHLEAVRRSLAVDFDIVYVYAGHCLGGLHHFLSRRYNNRTDEYGGSLENRARLLREILEDTVEAVDGKAAVACRITIDELLGDEGITRAEIEDVIGMLGEHPDLWDFVLGSWEDDSVTSRFGPEAEQEPYARGLKQLTTKPVVGVGRFTSPDMMVHQIKSGVLDLIGAARPSIADPFLPKKIETGQLDEIRECIGCNICVSGDFTMSPIRCTQNPTMGEEFRRGWHPERIRPKKSDSHVLVVGAGPTGLEAARSLGNRGYTVSLAESTRALGGRVEREAKLPGLSAWIRVVDYRLAQIRKLDNIDIFMQSEMTADDIIENDFDHVLVATGSHWRRDGVGRWHTHPFQVSADAEILTPDDLMAGVRPRGPTRGHLRRRPLLHGRRPVRVARRRGLRRRPDHPGGTRIAVDHPHPRGRAHQEAGHPRRCRRADQRRGDGGQRRFRHHRVRLHRGPVRNTGRLSGIRHRPAAGESTARRSLALVRTNGRRPASRASTQRVMPGRLRPSPPPCGPDTATPRNWTSRPMNARSRSGAR